jgi:hypothetical protein
VSLPERRSDPPNNGRLTEKTLMNILDKTDEVVFCGVWGNGGDDSAFAAAKVRVIKIIDGFTPDFDHIT